MLWAFWDFVIAFVILWANGNRKQKGYYAYLLIMAIILVQANQENRGSLCADQRTGSEKSMDRIAGFSAYTFYKDRRLP